ncbi:MAG: hypothetical protein JNL12_00850 [Planctomycetes bacterium]|nr:hypothetical protein [Planctomycetota bacterium]
MLRTSAVVALLALTACQSPPSPRQLPEGHGRGVVAVDATPPAGAPTWAAPALRIGDRFTLQRGDDARASFEIVGRLPDAYLIDGGAGPGGFQLRRGLDLSYQGEFSANGEPLHVLSPADVRYHWPLWVGKRWRCEFVDRTVGGPAMPVEVAYHVEAVETTTVPAGTFETLRIVRHERRRTSQGPSRLRTQLTWYAPSVGSEVRQLVDGELFELVAVERL